MNPVPITRHRDWQSRLQACIAARRNRPFAWGSQDCCLFPSDAVLAMTGHDPAADLRGYTTLAQAVRIVKRLGGMRAIGASRFGAEITPLLAQAGDIGLVVTQGHESLALCAGGHWLAAGEYGLESLPIDEALAAWRCT